MKLRCVPLLLAVIAHVGDAVRCFCDRTSCDDSPSCEADYCVIGFGVDSSESGDGLKLRQLCGVGQAAPEHVDRCEQRTNGEWQEVCYCREKFCNTFVFLRTRMDAQADSSPSLYSRGRSGGSSGGGSGSSIFGPPSGAGANTNKLLEFYPQPVPGDGGRQQRSSLIVLLVIIPLSVGALAVCLIFLNYHCKMC